MPDDPRKKLLILVDWFAPGYKAGGPIQSCVNLAFALKEIYQVYVLTTDTDHGEVFPYRDIVPNSWSNHIHPAIATYYIRKKTLNRRQLKKEIGEADADFIHLNHLFSPYFVVLPLWLKFTGRLKSKLILSPRGALFESALSEKRFKKKCFLFLLKLIRVSKHIIFHATNEREKEAINYHFPNSKILIANNLGNTNQPAFITTEKRPGVLKCIFIARIVPIKNLLLILELLENITGKIQLTIIGPVEDPVYWEKCTIKIKALPANITVDFLGPVHNNELLFHIRDHHLFILPTAGENFGHSIFESLLAGRLVLISDQTPWLQLQQKHAGWDVPLANREAFIQVMNEMTTWDQVKFDDCSYGAWKYANAFVKDPAIIQPYLELFS